MSHLSARHKIRMLELLQRHRHLRIVQIPGVGLPHRQTELLHRQSLREHRARIFQGHIPIRLYGEDLIEFRRKRETQRHYVTSRQPVKRTAIPSEPGVSHAVRFSGFCGRHSCAPRPSPGLTGRRRL